MEKQKTIFKDKDGYFIEQDGNRIYVKPVDSKEKDESKWTFTDGTNTYTPSQLQEKRAEYSSAYDPYALTDLLDWTAENTIGLPIKLAAQTEIGQKAIPYVGKVLSVAQPSKWYGTFTGKGVPWSEKNTGFGDNKHDKSLNTLVDWAISPTLVKGQGAVAKTVGKEATMQLALKGWSPAVKYVLGKPTVEQSVLSATTYSPTPVIRSESYLKPWKTSWTPGNEAKANIATKYYWSNKPESYFELVKDIEPESYSIHFKTPLGSITHGEKMGLFAKIADEVPTGSTISTYGELSKGGVHGIWRFNNDFNFRQIGSRDVTLKSGKPISIPILQKNPTIGNQYKNNLGSVIHEKRGLFDTDINIQQKGFGKYLGSGGEQVVFEDSANPNKVLKIYYDTYSKTPKELQDLVTSYLRRNNIPNQLKSDFIGFVTDKNYLYPVFRQDKVNPIGNMSTEIWRQEFLPKLTPQLRKYGITGDGINYEFKAPNGKTIIDINPFNIGVDKNGNYKFLDVDI